MLNAEHVWGISAALGGRVLLRIEDHDAERCRPHYEAGILDDLDWLGFLPDIFPTSCFRSGPCEGRQSDRSHLYLEAVEMLRTRGLVYACDCSRRAILERTADYSPGDRPDSPSAMASELYYDGYCRDRGLPLTEGVGWRVRLEPGAERFDDAIQGAQVQEPAVQCGDLLARDRRGNWTYQFAVTVDDWRQDIDLVIRGIDLLASTGRQIQLAGLLGRQSPPLFAHHRLIMRSPTQKLSKSDGDTGVRQLRAAGWTAREVRQHVLRLIST